MENDKEINSEESNDIEDKLKHLSKNKQVMQLIKQIMEKIARQKKYKKDSIEMMEELKKNLHEILSKTKAN